jgi:uncharacterized membrane protein (GlpM family)
MSQDLDAKTSSAIPSEASSRNAIVSLMLALFSPFLLGATLIVDLSINGSGFGAATLRLIALLPFWASIVGTFYLGLTNKRENSALLFMIVCALVMALVVGFFGLWLTFATFGTFAR